MAISDPNPQPGSNAPQPPGEAPGPAPRSAPTNQPPVRRTRLGGAWIMLTTGAVVLVLLLVFILMNGQRVEVHFYGAHLDLPLGVALLFAAALGVLLVLIPGAGRILQLRRAARKLHAAANRPATPPPGAGPDATAAEPGRR